MNFAQVFMIIHIIVKTHLKKKEHAHLEGKVWDYVMIKQIQELLIKSTKGQDYYLLGMDL